MDTSPPPSIVRADGLRKVFRDFWGRLKVQALCDVSFEVQQGQIFGLLGPNGSGKSTTIKILLGLLRPTAGHLEVLGQPPSDVRVKARIGYMPEESYIYRYLTPVETLDFYGRLFNLDAARRRQRIDQLLEMVGLQDARRRIVGEFSKGMARRVALAQALINDPDLILLDEPTSGLDPIGCHQIKDLILTLARRGKTIVLSSHLLADVEDVCDRIAILFGGRIRAAGRVSDLLSEQRVVRLSVPSPSPAALERLVGLVRQETGTAPQVDHPAKSLEQYFVEVIGQARQSEAGTSGPGGADVAEYLRK